jgi:P27 family predicted phage terminase small subunit
MSAGEEFRQAVDRQFDIDAGPPTAKLVLDQICRLLDELQEMETTLSREGLTTVGGNRQTVTHPLVAAARAHRLAIGRLTSQLGLEPESRGTVSAKRAAAARWSSP